jgi:chromosome segregation ATPase
MGLGKFGKLFFDEVEEENQTGSVSEKNTQTVAPNVSAQPTVQQPNVSTTPDAPRRGQLSEQYAELLLSAVKEADIPGPDFSELKAAFSSEDLKQNIPDVKTRWKTAFNMMKMMDAKLTKAHVLESIDLYIKVVDTEYAAAIAQFEKKYRETVGAKEAQVKSSNAKLTEWKSQIADMYEEIHRIENEMNAEQESINVLTQQISAEKADIDAKRADLTATKDAIKNSMSNDKGILTEVLPND